MRERGGEVRESSDSFPETDTKNAGGHGGAGLQGLQAGRGVCHL